MIHRILLVALLLLPRVALGEPTSVEPRSVAATLFDEGRVLLATGKYPEACAKFTESQRLEPRAGTLLNLATCEELRGRIATAWREFLAARDLAEREGAPDKSRFAEERLAVLGPRLPRLELRVLGGERTEMSLAIDGEAVARASWGEPLPVDPGEHEVTARAQGRVSWSHKVNVGERERVAIEVPALTREEEPPEPLRPAEGWVIGIELAPALMAGRLYDVRSRDDLSSRSVTRYQLSPKTSQVSEIATTCADPFVNCTVNGKDRQVFGLASSIFVGRALGDRVQLGVRVFGLVGSTIDDPANLFAWSWLVSAGPSVSVRAYGPLSLGVTAYVGTGTIMSKGSLSAGNASPGGFFAKAEEPSIGTREPFGLAIGMAGEIGITLTSGPHRSLALVSSPMFMVAPQGTRLGYAGVVTLGLSARLQ